MQIRNFISDFLVIKWGVALYSGLYFKYNMIGRGMGSRGIAQPVDKDEWSA